MTVAPKKKTTKKAASAKKKKPSVHKGKTREEVFGGKAIIERIEQYERNGTPGRPSSFKPEYGKIVKEMSAEGYSLTAIAGEIGVHRKTLYDWRRKYPEFDQLCIAATGLRQKAWEKKLIESKNAPSVTSAMFALRPIDPENFDVKKEMDLNVNDGKRQVDLASMPVEKLLQLQAIIQGHVESKNAVSVEYDETDE